jgi:hypothetical protein
MEMEKTSTYLKRMFRKAKMIKGNENLSFKNFVRKLQKDGDPQANAWFFHKSAAFNSEAKQARMKNKGARIAAEKLATKAARRKVKGGGKTTTTATTTAK